MQVKIVVVDSYQANPIAEFESSTSITNKRVFKIPVLRVFGISESGQKCCIHVHNALPYLLVPSITADEQFIANFALSVDALAGDKAEASVVYDVKVVSAYSMYGYNASESTFYKVILLNPVYIKKVSEVLLSGRVMGRRFQPFEAHIPYHLQFLINHNLFGMDWMVIKRAKFREGSWCNGVESGPNFALGQIQRRSVCAVECDIDAGDIENQHRPFGEASVSSLSALWQDERFRRQNYGMSADDVKLPVSPEGREIPVNERENALLKRFSDLTTKLKHGLTQIDEQIADQGLTQVLQDIIGQAESDAEAVANDWGLVQSTSTTDVFGSSMTQVLEGIVSAAEMSRSNMSEEMKSYENDPLDRDSDEEIEPGSILSCSQSEDNDVLSDEAEAEEMPRDDSPMDDLQNVDWHAFVGEDDTSSSRISSQLDGTNDKSSSKRPTPSRDESPPPRKTRKSVTICDIPSSSNVLQSSLHTRDKETPSPITLSSSSSSSSVLFSGVEASGKRFESGCRLDPIRTDSRQEGDPPNTLGLIIPRSPLSSASDFGTSSIYSFQSSTAYFPMTGESPVPVSPSSSPISDSSVKFTGFTPSQLSRTP